MKKTPLAIHFSQFVPTVLCAQRPLLNFGRLFVFYTDLGKTLTFLFFRKKNFRSAHRPTSPKNRIIFCWRYHLEEETTAFLHVRGTHTLDFSWKTTNAVLSDLKIVDVVKWFFKKLQIRSSRDLHNLWICSASILALQLHEILPQDFLWKFALIGKFSKSKSIRDLSTK